MKKYSTKLVKKAMPADRRGFTLVEVMIGMMILVVAIVTSTSLLINIMNSNKMIANHLKAYYLAQEGIEAVRNIRDTRWLNNRDWLDGGIYDPFVADGSIYSLGLRSGGWTMSPTDVQVISLSTLEALKDYYQWDFEKQNGPFSYQDNLIVYDVSGDKKLYPEFYRYIEFKNYKSKECEDKSDKDICNKNFILARSVVKWHDIGREYDVTLEEVLSNWKGGAL